MPVYGLILTLDKTPAQHQRVLSTLASVPHVTLGELAGLKLPLALESDSVEEGERLYCELGGLPGVVFQELVYVDFSDVETVESDLLRRRRRRERQTCEVSP